MSTTPLLRLKRERRRVQSRGAAAKLRLDFRAAPSIGSLVALVLAVLLFSPLSVRATAKTEVKGSPAPSEPSGATEAPAPVQWNPGVARLNDYGNRDPFRLPPPPPPPGKGGLKPARNAGLSLNLPPGPAGLLVDQIQLRGIVVDGADDDMIGIVTTDGADRAYFLQPGEAVHDGTVEQITTSAIYFRQRISDAHGGVSFRQVVKHLNPRKGS